MHKLIALPSLWLLSTVVAAQSTPKTVVGTVKDNQNGVIPGATVRLLNVVDSTLVKGEVTDGDGHFQLRELVGGTYWLRITALGQVPYTGLALTLSDTDTTITVVLPPIVLLPAPSINLQEVVVKAKRPLIEQDIDKTIVNVESMISASTSNTLEVLEKTPGVLVGANGEITLNGRSGVLVLVNGRPTYLSAQDLAAYLKSIPGGSLDQIELMDNPPARYDAGGNAIINIRLKLNQAGGFTGSLSTGYTQGQHARNNQSINLNYKRGRINLFTNGGYGHEKNYVDDRFDRRFYNGRNELQSSVRLATLQTYTNQSITANFGLDYTRSARTTYGVLVNLNGIQRNGQLGYTSDTDNASREPMVVGRGRNRSSDRRSNGGVAAYFVHRLGKSGGELSGDVNGLRYRTRGDQLIQTVEQPVDSLPTTEQFVYRLPTTITIYTAKADYVQPLKNRAKVEAGFKSSVVDNDNVFDYYTVQGSSRLLDNRRSNHFIYHETIHAAYLSTQKKWNRVDAQVGLRVENTQAIGWQLGNDAVAGSRFTKHYTRLFPSLFVSLKLDTLGNNTLNLSITRRINRPNYQLFNPFLFFRDNYSYTAGNPLLNPQYQYRYEVKYLRKQFLRVGLSYNRFTGPIFQSTEVVDDVFITRPDNLAGGHLLLLLTGLSVSPTKGWISNVDIRLANIGIQGAIDSRYIDLGATTAGVNLLNQFSFTNGWSAELGGYYSSGDLAGQFYTRGMVRVNMGIQKKVWKDKGSIRLSAEDLFHSWVYRNRSTSLRQADFTQTLQTDTQRIGFALTYRFGNDRFSRKSKYNTNASDEEKGRVTN